jgi:hypothetical protein
VLHALLISFFSILSLEQWWLQIIKLFIM